MAENPHPSQLIADAPEGTCFTKLLLNNQIISATLTSIRNDTGCTVKVSTSELTSGPQGFLSGSSDRVVVLSGPKQRLDQAVTIIVTAVRDHAGSEREVMNIDLRFVVPNSTVSLIIGKGGSRINQLREATGAKIQISSREPTGRMEAERIINVSGDVDNVKGAAHMILAIIQEDPSLRDFMYLCYPNAGGNNYGQQPAHNVDNMQPQPSAVQKSSNSSMLQINPQVFEIHTEIYLQIPDDFVGSLVGRNGQHLCDIRSTSGARVSISQRGELVPGTRDRLVTVSGPIRAVHTAHVLIIQRLADLQDTLHRNEMAGGGPQMGPPH